MQAREEERKISNIFSSNQAIVLSMKFNLLNVISWWLEWQIALNYNGNDHALVVDVSHSTADNEFEIQERMDCLLTAEGFESDELEVLELEAISFGDNGN